MTLVVARGDAAHLPLPDASVDLIVTSPPYFALRSYTDGGEHYAGQIGSEPTPAAYIAALVECTREWVRVLKPSGSIFVNLGDSYYSGKGAPGRTTVDGKSEARTVRREGGNPLDGPSFGVGRKSLCLLPERYRIACVDQLGLIARAVIVWAKPNGLPESVTDRVRRSHEDWVHLTKAPRYYAAVDEIREAYEPDSARRKMLYGGNPGRDGLAGLRATGVAQHGSNGVSAMGVGGAGMNPLGKLPGSVWEVATEPLKVPDRLGVDHFACVDDQTEILTMRGWLRHEELEPNDTVAGYDLELAEAVWTECWDVHRYDYDDELVTVESRDVSMRLTPNHRTIVQRMDPRSKRRGLIEVVRADELDRYHFIPRSTPWVWSGQETGGEAFAAVLGWVAAEGWYNHGQVYLSQSQDANPSHVRSIDGLLRDPLRRERKRVYQGRPWVDVMWRLSAEQAQTIKAAMPDKLLPLSWLLDATPGERRACLDAFIAGDGHRRPDGRIAIFQKHRHNLDVLQAVAVTLGYKTTLREGGNRFVLYLTEGGRSTTLRGTSGVGSKVRREHYKGTVWCPTTGTGTFIARRNGTVFITGNSFPSEWPRRLILGWSPPGICTACGEGRRPVATSVGLNMDRPQARRAQELADRAGLTEAHFGALLSVGVSDTGRGAATQSGTGKNTPEVYVLADQARQVLGGYAREYLLRRPTGFGYACACTPYTDHPGTGAGGWSEVERGNRAPGATGKDHNTPYERVGPWREYHFDRWTPPPTRPAVILDPFGGTGTTAHVAAALGRTGITVDLSADYCRVAAAPELYHQRRRKVLGLDRPVLEPVSEGQLTFEDVS